MASQGQTKRLFPRRLLADDVMTREVVTVLPDATYKEIERKMATHRVSALPVVDADGALIGIVSEADLLLKKGWREPLSHWHVSQRERSDRGKAAATTAEDLMSSPVISVDPGMPIALAARKMHQYGVKRLAIEDDDGKLVGILSRADILKSYLRSDEEICSEVVEGVIRNVLWLDPRRFKIAVSDGVVNVTGEVERRSEAEALVSLVRGLEGVVDVTAAVTYKLDDRHILPPIELRVS